MPTLEEVIEKQRKRLVNREANLADDIERMILDAIEDMESQAARAADLVNRRVTQGANPMSAMLTEARAQAYLQQLRDIVADVAGDALNDVLRERKALQIASAADFLDAANATDVHAGVNPQAIQRLGLSLASDSPVSRLFNQLPAMASMRATEALFIGVATGKNPRQTARAMTQGAAMTAHRAATIARTETLRAYRNAMVDRYKVTPEIERWVWISARDRRTCAMCWAMHGRTFPADVQMGTHPNCRCSQGPLPKGANTTAIVGNGTASFNKLSAAEQLHILGPAKFRAYKNGAFDLRDIVGTAAHPDWGLVRFEKSLRGMLGQQEATKYYKAGLSIVPPPPKPVAPRVRPERPARPAAPPRNPRPTHAEMVDWSQNKGWDAVKAHYAANAGVGHLTAKTLPNVGPSALHPWHGRGPAKDTIAKDLSRRLDEKALKDPALAAQIGKRTGMAAGTYTIADSLIGRWAGTSADEDTVALAVQLRASAKFNVPMPKYLEGKVAMRRADIDRYMSDNDRIIDAFLDAQRESTQEMLKAAGITELVLYRGAGLTLPANVTGQNAYGYMNKVTLQPLSSFSVDPATSTFFTGGTQQNNTITAMKVPVERILSTPVTGYGCFNEGEFVVIGGVDLPAHVVVGRVGFTGGAFQADSRPSGRTDADIKAGVMGEHYVFRMDDFKAVVPAD